MPHPLDSQPALLSASQTLRELCQDRRAAKAGVVRGSDGRLLALIDPAAQRIYATRPLELIVDSLADGSAALAELDPARSPTARANNRLADEALERLAWLFGARLAQDLGLAPWLDPSLSYRLLRWPDFGEIGSDPQGALLCRLIAQRQLDIAAMADAAQLPQRSVHGVLNSLSLCGVLASGAASPASVVSPLALTPEGWFARGWRRLRAGLAV